MENVACDLCGSDSSRLVYRIPDHHCFPDDWFSVVECVKCGLGYVNPRPTRTEIEKYYPAGYYEDFEVNKGSHLRRYVKEAAVVTRYVGRETGYLLDVGCANGGFPRYMQSIGWQVEGVEVSAQCRPSDDFTLHNVEFTQLPVCEPVYDAVTAWAVMEHVHEPMAYFKKAAQVLRPGGVFVFLVTNFDSTSAYLHY